MGIIDWFDLSSSLSGGFLRTIIFFLAIALFYVVGFAVYRVTLHPLATYPGPLLSRISGWPNGLDSYSGDRHIRLLHYHEIYGPVVRIAPNMVSINTPEALKAIYQSGKANVEKGWWYKFLYAAEGEYSTFTMINKDRHAQRRRLMSHAFSDNAIRGSQHLVLENIRIWTNILGKPKEEAAAEKDEWGQRMDMSVWSTYLHFDILGDLCFGQSFNIMTSDTFRFVPDLIAGYSRFLYSVGYSPVAPLLRPLMGTKLMEKIGGETNNQNLQFLRWAHQTMENRVKGDTNEELAQRKDFVHYLLRGKDPETGRGISLQELKGDSVLFIIAGADTSSTTLSAIFFYLVHHPHVLKKLTSEIRSTFNDVEEIRTGATLNSLTYLRACIDETLRMSPPVAGLLARRVLPGGLDVDGYHLSEGIEVGTSSYAIHHTEEYFPAPFTFRPERWIVDEAAGITAESVALAQSAFCPFSLGSRGCIGRGLAYVELSLAIARALFLYDVRQAVGDQTGEGDPALGWGRRLRGEYQIRDRFIAVRDGPILEFKPRQIATAA